MVCVCVVLCTLNAIQYAMLSSLMAAERHVANSTVSVFRVLLSPCSKVKRRHDTLKDLIFIGCDSTHDIAVNMCKSDVIVRLVESAWLTSLYGWLSQRGKHHCVDVTSQSRQPVS